MTPMASDLRFALVTAALAAAVAVGVFVNVMLRPDPETWRVVASGIGAAIFVGGLVAVVVVGRRRSRR